MLYVLYAWHGLDGLGKSSLIHILSYVVSCDGILCFLCSISFYLDIHLLRASPACYGTYFYNVAVVTVV